MANQMLVNKTGRQIPIYRDTSGQVKIGTLYPNEHYSYVGNWGGDGIFNRVCFRNSSGKIAYGFVIDDIGIYDGTGIFDFPHSSVQIGTRWYRTLKLCRNEKIYNKDGQGIDTGVAGCLVGIRDSEVGSSHPEWKKIYYIQRSSDKAWVKVDGTGAGYGYINIGYDKGSMPSDISLYGKGY